MNNYDVINKNTSGIFAPMLNSGHTNPVHNKVSDAPTKKQDDKKLQKTLICLGAALAATVGIYALVKHNKKGVTSLKNIKFDAGVASYKDKPFTGVVKDTLKNGDKINLVYENGVLQNSTRKGSVNLHKIFDIQEGKKTITKIENGITSKSTIYDFPKNNILRIQELANDRLKVVLYKNGKAKTIELPQYLYHMTSEDALKNIMSSGSINISKNEQLRGLYLFDSANFLDRYQQTQVNGKNLNLFNALFKQANKKKVNGDEGLIIFKIPTQDLLESGKIRVRTQEDFFKYNTEVKRLSKLIGKNYKLRTLYDDKAREEFRKLLISQNIMSEQEVSKFMNEMTSSIHLGYSLPKAFDLNLEKTHSIEYIFNKDIKLADFPNIETIHIPRTVDYIDQKSGNFVPDKVRQIFEQAAA